MGIFRQFPYSNFHDMNMDTVLRIMREMQDEWAATKAEWASYKEFIDNYFNNLDVSAEVLAALRIFAADGTLNKIMDPVIASETSNWLAEHISATAGETVIDTSLTVAGAAADAKAAGDEIRTNRSYITNLERALQSVRPVDVDTWTIGKNLNPTTGALTDNQYTAATNSIFIKGGAVILRTIPAKDNSNYSLIMYVAQYNTSGFKSRTALDYNDVLVTDSDCVRVRIAFGRTSNSNTPFTEADITNYWSMLLCEQMVTFYDYNLNTMINRGRINVDYPVTALSDCTETGFYTFGIGDVANLPDLPADWSTGGILETFNNTHGGIWQRVSNLTREYIRYSVNGEWSTSDKQNITVEYDNTAGDENSTEHIKISIPRTISGKYTQYMLGHCVNTDINADVWRIMRSYANTRQITMAGEWECALHLAERDDFSGGITHGDEVITNIIAFVDGTRTDIKDLNTKCTELKIVRSSNLYDPADHTTVIAEHGVEYVFNAEGLTLKQSVKWLGDYNLTNCFMTMLPIIKAYSTQRFDNTSFKIINNDTSDYSISIPDGTEITEFNDNYDIMYTVGITDYPSGLAGGDRILVTDNHGINYNKIYYPVCASGSVTAGTVWKATSYYKTK